MRLAQRIVKGDLICVNRGHDYHQLLNDPRVEPLYQHRRKVSIYHEKSAAGKRMICRWELTGTPDS